jgi:hypothetical protein
MLDALKREPQLAEQEEERRRERKQKMQQKMQQVLEQREMEQREGHAQEVSRFDLAKVALARTGEKAKVLFQMWSPYKVALDAQPIEELGETRVRKRLDLGEDGNDEESEDDKTEGDEDAAAAASKASNAVKASKAVPAVLETEEGIRLGMQRSEKKIRVQVSSLAQRLAK